MVDTTHHVDINERMLIILSLDPSACLIMTPGGRWYVRTRLEKGGDGFLSSCYGPAADTPAQAICYCLMELQATAEPLYITSGVYYPGRRQWRWNGAAFTEVAP